MRQLVARSLFAGLVTGGLAAVLMVGLELLWDGFHTLWPTAFVPVFVTGVYAWHRCRDAVSGPGRAALAGGVAGLVAGTLVSVTNVVLMMVADPPAHPTPHWTLIQPLLDGPFYVPGNSFYYDVAAPPFRWVQTRVVGGILYARVPLTLPLYPFAGALLAGLQAWLYHLLARRADVTGAATGVIARSRATFQSKLRLGFVLLTAAIFTVGWLGWASTEEMHQNVHVGRVMEHFQGHGIALQRDLRTYGDLLSGLNGTHDAPALQQVGDRGKSVAAQLAHLVAVPPPPHPVTDMGNVGQKLRDEAERRLPVTREANSRFGDLSKAAARVADLYRAGSVAEAEALLPTLVPLQRAVDAPVAQLVGDLDADLGRWASDIDEGGHLQLLFSMLLVLVMTGIALPLGHVFSQVVVRPVGQIGSGLERIGRGDFATAVAVENRDELGDLAARVNRMGTELERLYGELRALNEGLQQRVQDAVREIERSRMLRRYLPHQVADAVIASGDESLLQTHRREITVVFGDLRGFTAFAETAEPEVVMQVLADYHGAVGELISRFSGTLEHFAGDGWMVYFNDPLPVSDHPAQAVRMAVAMRERVGELARGWRKLGFELDFGIGIAIGYATLGTIGFEGRHDYGAIGSVANLASRLSDEAQGGQIIVSQRVQALVEDVAVLEPAGSLLLKGFVKPVVAYNVVGLREVVAARS